MGRAGIIALAVALVGLGTAGTFFGVRLSATATARSVGSDEAAILAYVTAHPEKTHRLFSGIQKLVASGEWEIDGRTFSDTAHDAGMSLIQQGIPLKQAVMWCGDTFKYGCVHGAVMEYIDTTYPGDIGKGMLVTCDQFQSRWDPADLVYLNCLHAVGHSFVAHNGGTVETTLDMCSSYLSTGSEISVCGSGVYMEYSTGERGLGYHSHQSVGSIALPCTDDRSTTTGSTIQLITLDNFNWLPICYASSGSYRQYYPDQEPWDETFAYCATLPERYQDDCELGVMDRLRLSQGYSTITL